MPVPLCRDAPCTRPGADCNWIKRRRPIWIFVRACEERRRQNYSVVMYKTFLCGGIWVHKSSLVDISSVFPSLRVMSSACASWSSLACLDRSDSPAVKRLIRCIQTRDAGLEENTPAICTRFKGQNKMWMLKRKRGEDKILCADTLRLQQRESSWISLQWLIALLKKKHLRRRRDISCQSVFIYFILYNIDVESIQK